MIRRVLSELYADWRHEIRAAATPFARSRASLAVVAATARVAIAMLRVFDEGHLMRNLGRDFRYAFRRLRATPLFTAFAIITLGLGIGVTTAIYSAVREVSSPPSGLTEPERLVRITRTTGASGPLMSFSWPEYQEYLQQQTVFDRVAAWRYFRQTYSANGRTGTSFGESVSGQYFEALGVGVQIGRALRVDDDRPEAPPVAVVSDATWKKLFDASPAALGQTVKMNGVTFQIVGVARPDFHGLFNGGIVPSAMWVPLQAMRLLPNQGVSFDVGDRNRPWIFMTARLAPGRTFEQADAETTTISRRINETYPGSAQTRSGETIQRVASPWVTMRLSDIPKPLGADRIVRPLMAALMTAVGLVLLVACTNLANLMLARGVGRQQESAVRRALGASRWRLVRESLAESVLLAVVGGALAIGVARVLMIVLGTDLDVGNGVALQIEPRLSLAVLGAALVATLLALVIAGVGPALFASRADVRGILATDGLGARSTRWRVRRYLITGQVAVSVFLVALAALCVRQVVAHGRVDTGVDFAHLALIEVDFAQQQYDEARVRAIVEQVLAEARRDPVVRAASVSSGLPLGIGTPGAGIRSGPDALSTEFVSATPAILDTLAVALVRGRTLDERDVKTSAPVVVISQFAAEDLFGTIEVVGRDVEVKRRTWAGEPDWPSEHATIVGVAADTDDGASGSSGRGVIYVPWAQHYEGRIVFAARATTDSAQALKGLRQALAIADPEAPVTQALTGTSLQSQDTLFFQVVAGLASVLGTMALVLALAGLYGILSFVVAGRAREIGIRIALGADAALIRRQVLREGLSPVMLGLVAGLGTGAIARMGLGSVFERLMPAFDMSVFVLVPALFIAAGLAASFVPAWRASRVDANVALKNL